MSYGWLFGVSALLTASALLIVLLYLKESNTRTKEKMGPRNLSHILKDGTFLAYTAVSVVIFLLMGQMMSTLSVYTVDFMGLSTAQYGMLLTTNGLMVVFLQYPMSYKLNRASKPAVLIAGSLLFALGYFLFGCASGFALSILAMVVVSLGEIVYAPTAMAVIGELAPPRYSGRYMGVYGLTQILGIAMGPLLGGVLLDAFPASPLLLWGIISILGVASAFGYYLWSVRYKLPDTPAD
jgi:MFS family permease